MAGELLTEEEYLAVEGTSCPRCSSKAIEWTGKHHCDGKDLSHQVICIACNLVWDDWFTLSGYEVEDVE
jgi:hypothetical protein